MSKSLWEQMLPALAALIQENQRAGMHCHLPTNYGLAESEPEIGHLFFQLKGSAERKKIVPLPIEGRYWDADGHIAFLGAFASEDGTIAEVELYRLDLHPIQKIPSSDELKLGEVRSGYYETTNRQKS